MITRPYELEVCWDGGEEPAVAAAAKVANLLSLVTDSVPDTSEWYFADGDALTRFERTDFVTEVARAFEPGTETWTYGSARFQAQTLHVTNARPRAKGVRLAFKCRTLPRSEVGIWFANHARISVWGPRAGWLEPERLTALFDGLCRCFLPAWGSAGPPDWPERSMQEKFTGIPKVSALTYLGPEYPVPSAGTGSVEPVAEAGGHRLTAVGDWFDVSNAEHVARVEAVRAELAAVGALRARTLPVPD